MSSSFDKTRKRFERPILPPINASKVSAEMERAIRESDRAVMAQLEADRIAMRRARANDPHRCHCPHCYVIG